MSQRDGASEEPPKQKKIKPSTDTRYVRDGAIYERASSAAKSYRRRQKGDVGRPLTANRRETSKTPSKPGQSVPGGHVTKDVTKPGTKGVTKGNVTKPGTKGVTKGDATKGSKQKPKK